MTDTDEVLRYLHLAKERVEAGGIEQPPGTDAVHYARDRLIEALPHAHAGTELPAGVRLRPLKQAAHRVGHLITGDQVPFNRALLQAMDGLAAAVENLAYRVESGEQHANRVQAGVATADLTLDVVIEDLRVLRDRQATLEAALARAEATAAEATARADALAARLDEALAARTDPGA
ncbi:MAG: hypothetical protein KDB04_02865 [Acidimicrobiales bacterium]|nr:hypothetical protein [Acidimicrobiales bacterium]MCB1038522.1 hypothetical protein [Acidimicrobiales bacterium]